MGRPGMSTRAVAMIAVLFFGMLSSAALAAEDVQQRKLLQLQRPWLRIPVYDQINPFQVVSALSSTLFDNVGYGVFDDYLGDFFDDSFSLVQAGITDIGCALRFC
mmetsp:Transcript_3683/g.9588  ORF Transcript_3683/g.9588 Transcript_3683/m.9588 type:complete len:105 (-) Transcript_3683:114-428(-)